MRFLPALILPVAVLSQGGLPVGNPVGAVLGIFAMCGTDPVDCGNGWCCLAGQTCTGGSRGANTMCNDPVLLGANGKPGVTVNAAYFGKLTDNQVSPPGNGSTAVTSHGGSGSGSGSSPVNGAGSIKPEYLLISSLLGATAVLINAI